MRRILIVLSVAALMAAMMVASGLPAFAQSQGVGPGPCIPPGEVFSETAKLPGPNSPVPYYIESMPPGQVVKEFCAPGQQGPDPDPGD